MVDKYESEVYEVFDTVNDAPAGLPDRIMEEAKAACKTLALRVQDALLQLGQIWGADNNNMVGDTTLAEFRSRMWDARDLIRCVRRDLSP